MSRTQFHHGFGANTASSPRHNGNDEYCQLPDSTSMGGGASFIFRVRHGWRGVLLSTKKCQVIDYQEFQFRSETNANFLDAKAICRSAKSQSPGDDDIGMYGTRLFGFQLRCHHRLGWQDPFFMENAHFCLVSEMEAWISLSRLSN